MYLTQAIKSNLQKLKPGMLVDISKIYGNSKLELFWIIIARKTSK
jgi:hypothetical protein